MTQLLRTAHQGCWRLTSNGWGQYLAPTADPDANVVLSNEQLQGFELHDGIQRLPAELWSRWIELCMHFAQSDKRQLEVSCRFLRREDDKSQWRVVIPPQAVGGASVRADGFDGSIDIATGEVIEQWPPDGWLPCGSSHSHNTMQAFFSGTDDRYELGDPGLHIVVGELNATKRTYTLMASVTACGRRFEVDHQQVIDVTAVADSSFHPAVLDVVKVASTQLMPWPQTTQRNHPNAGNGYSDMALLWDDNDGLPAWDPANWHARSAKATAGGGELLAEPIKDAIDGLVKAAISSGDEQQLDQCIGDLIDHLQDIQEDLMFAHQSIAYYD